MKIRTPFSLTVISILLAVTALAVWFWFAPRPYHGVPPDQLNELGRMGHRQMTASPAEHWKWSHSKIEVHGIVVDDSGAPVPDARLNYQVQILGDLDQEQPPILRAGPDGRFVLPEGRGYRASVLASHPEYHYLPESSAVVFPRGSIYVALDRLHFYSDEEVRLVLRKKLPREPLVQRLGELHHFATDGTLSLPVDKTGAKRLLLHLTTTPSPAGRTRFDWELRISPRDGRIQTKKERAQYLAPADGYAPEIVITKRVSDKYWNIGGEQEYFLRFDDGTYAWVRVSSDAQDKFVYYSCNYNPAKSRNLEPGLKVE